MSITSLSSISTLNLWLDATDLTTMVFDPIFLSQMSTINPSLLQWNDKSSNAYNFFPIRPDDRPKISTNAILFDQVSSFHLVSKQKIRATSTLDFFAVVTPFSLLGPRAPIFDSADITVAETDTRFNVQIYADGNEFGFRGVSVQNCNSAAAVYRGDLYIGTYAATGAGPGGSNFLQKYNRTTRSFHYLTVPMRSLYTHALTVFDGRLYAAGGQIVNFNSGGASGQGVGPAEIWDGVNTRFLSTSFISTFPSALTVHKRQLYAFTTSGWGALYLNNNTTTLATQNRPQMYVLNPLTNNFTFVADTQSIFNTSVINGPDFTAFTSNAISFRGELFISGGSNNSHGRTLTRFTNLNVYASNNLNGSMFGYLSVFLGSLIVPFVDNSRIFKYNESVYETMGRWNTNNAGNGGMTTYKGKLHGIFSIAGTNWIQVFAGDPSSMYSNSAAGYSNLTAAYLTTNVTGTPNCNLMIVHDGKLFVQNGSNTAGSIIEYGNGISMDQSFSTLVASPILINVRKTLNATQLYLNGTLVQSQTVNFSYSNQPDREMWIGGAAGLMQSGLSDSGSDHFQGAIHSVAQYSSNLNMNDRQRVEGILAWTFGIQNVLPASHPYRNSRP
jgi:hypothetical protein